MPKAAPSGKGRPHWGQEVVVGAYSTRYQWTKITGGASIPALPNWYAGARHAEQAAAWCADHTFSDGPTMLVQWVEGGFDRNFPCVGSDLVLGRATPGTEPPPQTDLLTELLRKLGLAPKA